MPNRWAEVSWSGPWRRPGAAGLMRDVAALAAIALKLVRCLFATQAVSLWMLGGLMLV